MSRSSKIRVGFTRVVMVNKNEDFCASCLLLTISNMRKHHQDMDLGIYYQLHSICEQVVQRGHTCITESWSQVVQLAATNKWKVKQKTLTIIHHSWTIVCLMRIDLILSCEHHLTIRSQTIQYLSQHLHSAWAVLKAARPNLKTRTHWIWLLSGQ